jgi:hypothetical protein
VLSVVLVISFSPLLIVVLFPIISPRRFGPLSLHLPCRSRTLATRIHLASSRSQRWWCWLLAASWRCSLVSWGSWLACPLRCSPVVIPRSGCWGGRWVLTRWVSYPLSKASHPVWMGKRELAQVVGSGSSRVGPSLPV